MTDNPQQCLRQAAVVAGYVSPVPVIVQSLVGK